MPERETGERRVRRAHPRSRVAGWAGPPVTAEMAAMAALGPGCPRPGLWYSPASGPCLSFRASDRCLTRKSCS